VRKIGWLMVGSGLLVAAGGHYVMYSAARSSDVSSVTVGLAFGGICLAVVGLLIVQIRS